MVWPPWCEPGSLLPLRSLHASGQDRGKKEKNLNTQQGRDYISLFPKDSVRHMAGFQNLIRVGRKEPGGNSVHTSFQDQVYMGSDPHYVPSLGPSVTFIFDCQCHH